MKYLIQKDVITQQIISLHRSGGQFQKAAEKIKSVVGDVSMGIEEPLKNIPTTNNGETRIKNCIKYDLPGFCRLVTIQNNGICAIVYAGKHDECDKWLDSNKGYTLTLKNNELVGLKITKNLEEVEPNNNSVGPISDGTLLNKLKDRYLEIIQESVNALVYKKIELFDCFTEEEDIISICCDINQEGIQEMVLDVLIALKDDDVDQAKNRMLVYEEEIKLLNQAKDIDIKAIVSGEEFILLDDFMDRDMHALLNTTSWLDWMLFMHPQQRKVVEEDYSGPARLLGVSGSGKTCVTVNRAIRLAKKYPEEKILITTINPALAKLIKELLILGTESDNKVDSLSNQIEVKSFWELCREMLLEYETNDLLKKGYNQYTDKNQEDVDAIWKEYFLCEYNNRDADILKPINQSLISRNVLPLEYLKQEFDWIRSALPLSEREEYLTIEREGRSEPLQKEFRKLILEGLEGWENKMSDVGVCDYLGLLGPLQKYFNIITPKYRSILVDELQDFGTTELTLVRMLTTKQENDLFLCGDIAQQVQTKHHMITKAGITIQPQNYLKIKKNYRNSREILEAASHVFQNNIDPNQYTQTGFELLNPEYANFSSPKPFVRKQKNINFELKYAIAYLKDILNEKEKACIAICGLTYFQVKHLGDKLNIPVLDGEIDIQISNIFISDLDQTKGFEFDRMLILNCNEGIFPNPKLPEKEWFREISKLYVSMTRAKKELIISYSTKLSDVFLNSLDYFNTTTQWEEYINDDIISIFPDIITEVSLDDFSLKMIGMDFLYSKMATGLTHSAQEKILELIKGIKSTNYSGNVDGWKNMESFIADLNNNRIVPHMNKLLGPSVYRELKSKFEYSKF